MGRGWICSGSCPVAGFVLQVSLNECFATRENFAVIDTYFIYLMIFLKF
jgi:hypothetical protein